MGKAVLCGALAVLCLAGAALCSESGALVEGKPVPSGDRCGALPAGWRSLRLPRSVLLAYIFLDVGKPGALETTPATLKSMCDKKAASPPTPNGCQRNLSRTFS